MMIVSENSDHARGMGKPHLRPAPAVVAVVQVIALGRVQRSIRD